MSLDINKIWLVLLPLILGACSTAGSGNSGANTPAPATGTVVAQSDMPGVCQNAAASKYNEPLENITSRESCAAQLRSSHSGFCR